MTGPEHYREAERLAQLSLDHFEYERPSLAALTMRQAQVHATLALTAATVDVAGATVNGVVSTGWSGAIS